MFGGPVEFDPSSLPKWLNDFSPEEQEMVRTLAEVDLAFRERLFDAQTPEYRAYLVRYEARRWWRRGSQNAS